MTSWQSNLLNRLHKENEAKKHQDLYNLGSQVPKNDDESTKDDEAKVKDSELSVQTTEISIHSTAHGRLRRGQRSISKYQLRKR